MGLTQYLLMEGGRANVGRKTISSLFETVSAAIYLDGGYASAKEFILKHATLDVAHSAKNYKGVLQEFVQGYNDSRPSYRMEKMGKDNDPEFRSVVTALGKSADGYGKTKREAEQEAARKILEILLGSAP